MRETKHVFTEAIFNQILDLMTKSAISIQSAAEQVGVPYWVVIQKCTAEQKHALKSKSIRPGRPVRETRVRETPRQEHARPPLIHELNFPKTVWCWQKNFLDKYSSHGARFFLRIEAEEYFVVGYEYLLPNGDHEVDQVLHDFNTDVQLALSGLKKKLADVLNKETESEHGRVRYCLKPAPPHDHKTIMCKTKINVADGEYRCRVARDLGFLEHNGYTYQFVIADTVPMTLGVKLTVKDKIGTIHL